MSGAADSPPSGAAPNPGSPASISGDAAGVAGTTDRNFPVDRLAPAAIAALDAALLAAGVPARRLADDHRGIQLQAGGWPLDVGIAIQDGLLRAQGEVLGPDQVDPHDLLHDHRKRPFARFSHADGGAVWVEAELPLLAATPDLIDAMLGALLELADQGRRRAVANRAQ